MKANQSKSCVNTVFEASAMLWLVGIAMIVVGGLIVTSVDGLQTVPLWVRYISGALFAFGLFRAWKTQTDKGLQAAVALFLVAVFSLGLWHYLGQGQQSLASRALQELAKVVAVVFPLLGGSIAAVYPNLDAPRVIEN
jgi:hypothetical protein